jgi:hypothetical protein
MELQDRLFSENTDEVLYSILMDEDEYSLYSEFCSLFSKKDDEDEDEDEDRISEADIAKAAAIAAGATGVGAGVGKALEHQGKKKLKGLVTKRALQGAVGSGVVSGAKNAYKLKNDLEVLDSLEKINGGVGRGIYLPRPELGVEGNKRLLKKGAIARTIIGAKAGGAAGALRGAVEKHLKEKKLKGLIKKGAGAGLAAGTLASAGYLAHKAYKKNKKKKD